MEQLLKTAQELVVDLKAKRAEVEATIKALNEKEQHLAARERDLKSRIDARVILESAAALEAQAKKYRDEAQAQALRNDEAKAALQTAENTQRERLEAARSEARSILEQAGNVKADRAKLEAEKENYKAQILDEIRSKLG